MTNMVDREVLGGFIEEAQSYMPAIQQGIADFRADQNIQSLEVAHRHMHTIKGAAGMVGLGALSQVAGYVEDTLEAISAGQHPMDNEMTALLSQTVIQIKGYLAEIMTGDIDQSSRLAAVIEQYQALDLGPGDSQIDTYHYADHRQGGTSPIQPDDILPELMEVFALEAEDHIRQINLSLNTLDHNPADEEALQELRRRVHTIKGASSTVGLDAVAQLSHRMEDMLDQMYESGGILTSSMMKLMFTSAFMLEDLIDGDIREEAIPEQLDLIYNRYQEILDTQAAETARVAAEPEVEEQIESVESVEVVEAIELEEEPEPEPQEEPVIEAVARPVAPPKAMPSLITILPTIEEPERRTSGEMVRVPIEKLNELVNLVGELVITHTSFEQRMHNLTREVDELQPSITRLRRTSSMLETQYEASALGGGQWAAEIGNGPNEADGQALPSVGFSNLLTFETYDFDELEFDRYTEFHLMSRGLAEATSDVRTIGSELRALISEFDSVLNRQGRVTSELQQKLMQVRMVPLSILSTRLHRAVRVVAEQRNKMVDLLIEGENIDIDKSVLEEIADPLLHLLRNAVDHGIEMPDVRRKLDKPERGQIQLHAYHEGNQVVIWVQDDGRGLDIERIRVQAVAGNYLTQEEADDLSDRELQQMIFLPGFSTASEVSEVSGRGVGMDIVRANVHQLKGSLTLNSAAGEGTTFTIRLPMTLSITRALLVRTHNELYAIPQEAVSQIMRLSEDSFEILGQEQVLRIEEEIYPVIRLADVLKLTGAPDDTIKRFPVLIIKSEEREIALVVEHLVEGRNIVIKSLGDHLRQVPGIAGATLMGDGSVVLILNPNELAQPAPEYQPAASDESKSASVQRYLSNVLSRRGTGELLLRGTDVLVSPLNIMIVDDSISVRRVVANMIKNAGWRPFMARDGLEALENIQQAPEPPDLILLDIEMPRMDGYELTTTLKRIPAYQDIPIVMLTSRAGEKHRRKAFEVGVTDYLIKPYQDEVLLSLIRKLTEPSQTIQATLG